MAVAEVRLVLIALLLAGCADRVTKPEIFIRFPAGWREVTPNKGFTLRKAMAPSGYASIGLMRREGLWDGDASARYDDAWTALREISPDAFSRQFERNDPTGNETPTVLLVRNAALGGEHAVYVEYELADRAKGVAVRIHSYLVLHGHEWYAVAMATRASDPTMHRDEMEASAKTFRLRDV